MKVSRAHSPRLAASGLDTRIPSAARNPMDSRFRGNDGGKNLKQQRNNRIFAPLRQIHCVNTP